VLGEFELIQVCAEEQGRGTAWNRLIYLGFGWVFAVSMGGGEETPILGVKERFSPEGIYLMGKAPKPVDDPSLL